MPMRLKFVICRHFSTRFRGIAIKLSSNRCDEEKGKAEVREIEALLIGDAKEKEMKERIYSAN